MTSYCRYVEGGTVKRRELGRTDKSEGAHKWKMLVCINSLSFLCCLTLITIILLDWYKMFCGYCCCATKSHFNEDEDEFLSPSCKFLVSDHPFREYNKVH